MADCQTDVPLTSNVKELLLTTPICMHAQITQYMWHTQTDSIKFGVASVDMMGICVCCRHAATLTLRRC